MARSSLGVCLLLLVTLSAVYEVQGTFLLRHYMRKFPRRSRDFSPFACQGMLKFVDVLEVKCPFKPEYKNFFGKLKGFMNFLNSASGSKNFDVELKGQAEGLHSAMSAMSGKGGSSADSSKVMDVLMSMGKTLSENQRSGSTIMTFGQRKDLTISMAKWARVISQFVSSAAAKSGSSIDISSLGLDGIDANIGSSSPETGTSFNKGSGTPAGGSTNTGSGTTAGGSTDTSSGTAAGGSDTTAGGSTDTSSGTTAGGSSTTAGGSTNTGYGTVAGGSTNTGYGTAAGGSSGSTTSCTTSACSSGGGTSAGGGADSGSSYKRSINYQQSGERASQQTATGSS